MKIFVNSITVVRLFYTLLLPILYGKISNIAFLGNIIFLFLTDSIDGILARKYKVQTLFGSVMDTIADKVLCIVLLLIIVNKERLLLLAVLGEVIIAAINVGVEFSGKRTGSNMFGKLKMWFISVTIILAYMTNFGITNKMLERVAVILTAIMQIITIISYIVSYAKQEKNETLKNDIKQVKNANYYLHINQ